MSTPPQPLPPQNPVIGIDIKDRYKLIFEEHHFASDFRVKIVQGWCLFYVAFAAGLGWAQSTPDTQRMSWIFSALACVITVFMWSADFRHRSALANSKRIGKAIEESKEAEIPPKQRFFASIASDQPFDWPSNWPSNRFFNRLFNRLNPLFNLAAKWMTHSLAIDVLAGFMLGALGSASVCLEGTGGNLSSILPDSGYWAIGGGLLGAALHVVFAYWLKGRDKALAASSVPTSKQNGPAGGQAKSEEKSPAQS